MKDKIIDAISVEELVSSTQYKDNEYYLSKDFLEAVKTEGNISYHLGKLFELFNKQYIRIPDQKKINLYQEIKEDLDFYTENKFILLDERPSEDGLAIALTIRYKTIIGEMKAPVFNFADTLELLFENYKDFFSEVDNGYVKFCFTVKLYEQMKVLNFEKELELQAIKYKVLISENILN